MTSQPPPPAYLLDPQGEPLWGAYTGPFGRVDLSDFTRRKGPLFGVTRHKRWFYFAIATETRFFGMAITDLSYAANAFLFAAEVGPGGRMLADFSAIGVPRVGCQVGDFAEEGCDAWFRVPGAYLSFRRPRGSSVYEITADTRDIKLHASLSATGPAPHGAIARPDGGELMVTEKRVLMPTVGIAEVRGERISLDGALGGLDYSQGFPPRDTAWRWGFLMGKTTGNKPIAMNLVQGFNGAPECVVWFAGTSYPLGEGRFTLDEKDPLQPWSIVTDDGLADLSFEPSAIHREERDLGVVQSRFLHPIGVYRGVFNIPGKGKILVDGVPGVAEDQRVRW